MDYIKLAYTSASYKSQPLQLTQKFVFIIDFVISANIKIEYSIVIMMIFGLNPQM